MTSFNGSISFEGLEPSDQIVQQAISLAIRTRHMRDSGSLSRLFKAYDLPSGEQVYIMDMEHVWQVHIISAPPQELEVSELPVMEVDAEGVRVVPIAGLLSGVAYWNNQHGVLDFREADWPHSSDPPASGTPQGVVSVIYNDAIDLTPESAALFPLPEASIKLGVPLHEAHLRPNDPTLRSQFYQIIPGRYTGAMASIVQLMLGVGRLVTPDYEERWAEGQRGDRGVRGTVVRPDRHSDDVISKEAHEVDSFYFQKGRDVQLSYDYRWNRTHGILWGQNNTGGQTPVLVELGQRGAYVMEFPLDELSKYPAVQDYYEQVYPHLAEYRPFRGQQETLFEAFGGFPTGGNFPANDADFMRWQRAGLIAKASNDLSSFYNGATFMSSMFGWAFHPTQPRAINTMYKHEPGGKFGYCYEVVVSAQEKAEGAKTRNPIYSQTVAALGLSDPVDLYKAARLPVSFAEQMVQSPSYSAFDAYEVSPDWAVDANLVLIKRGGIDYPGLQCPPSNPCHIIDSPHFKYYEPIIDMVINFDFLHGAASQYADGPIFATYLNRGAEIINYYHTPTPSHRPPVHFDSRQPCQYVGTWDAGTYTHGSELSGYFYCSSRDFRRQVYKGGGNVTTTEGEIIGSADHFQLNEFFGTRSRSTKVFFGTERWWRTRWGGEWYRSSISCAANHRSAFLVCAEYSQTGRQRSEGFSGRKQLGISGTVLYGWIYNTIWHWNDSGSWPMCAGDPMCMHDYCPPVVENPESCFGIELPAEIGYSVCPTFTFASDPETYPVISSPTGEAIIMATYYSPIPQAPPGWSTSSTEERHFDWEIRLFGVEVAHNKVVKSKDEVFSESSNPPQRATLTDWWKCSIVDECPSPKWYVSENFYGIKHVSAYSDLNYDEVVDFGADLRVRFGPRDVPFGVVD